MLPDPRITELLGETPHSSAAPLRVGSIAVWTLGLCEFQIDRRKLTGGRTTAHHVTIP
jgi:hypothetical protein